MKVIPMIFFHLSDKLEKFINFESIKSLVSIRDEFIKSFSLTFLNFLSCQGLLYRNK